MMKIGYTLEEAKAGVINAIEDLNTKLLPYVNLVYVRETIEGSQHIIKLVESITQETPQVERDWIYSQVAKYCAIYDELFGYMLDLCHDVSLHLFMKNEILLTAE